VILDAARLHLAVPGDAWEADRAMEIAFSYLRVLAESGYFERAHVSGDGVWFKGHPACQDAKTWESVRRFLVDGGYLEQKYLPEEEQQRLHLHPKDTLDAWWFVLTPRGREALGRSSS
jgi:hypothetical protein